MINESTLETLKGMHCSAMAEELKRQMEDPATYSSLGFEERLGLIIDAEWNRRQKTNLRDLLKKHIFQSLRPALKESNTFRTGNLIKRRSYALQPASISMTIIISY